MKISENGLKLIKQCEGCVLHIYKDQAGLDTIGIGHLLTESDKKSGRFATGITDEQAFDLLREDASDAEAAVNSLVKVSINQNQFDALVDFTFNLGKGALGSSNLLKRLNKSDYDVSQEFLKWNKVRDPKTKQLVASAGLAKRRQKESILWTMPLVPV